VVRFAPKATRPLSFRSQVYRRGICLLPAAKQQIPRATRRRFGMAITSGTFQAAPLTAKTRLSHHQQRGRIVLVDEA